MKNVMQQVFSAGHKVKHWNWQILTKFCQQF